MTPPNPVPARPVSSKIIPGAPRPRWWRTWATEGNPPQLRPIVHWNRILGAAGILALAGYVGLMTALWWYYAGYRKISGVQWYDVVSVYRFSHVQDAIGAQHYAEAKEFWAKGDILRALFTARAAVQKSPANLDARLFLASAWMRVGRPEDCIRTLREGIPYDASDPRLATALMQACLKSGRNAELLAALRTDFPAQHVNLLESQRDFQLAEVRAVFELESPAAAAACAAGHPGLELDARAAPLLGEIDWALHREAQAVDRLRQAAVRNPRDPQIEDKLIDLLLRSHQTDEARQAAATFYRQYPTDLTAELRALEVYGNRDGADAKIWAAVCIRMLAEFRHQPDALGKLGSLAASKGWTDLTYLLYQNSLQESLDGFPFVTYYVGSLIKTGDVAKADEIWRELAPRNGGQTTKANFIGAMIDWGTGRESEARQIVAQMRQDTADNRGKRSLLESTFRAYGYPQLADLMIR